MVFNHMILNKEDFEDIRPIQKVKSRDFSMYTKYEIDNLTPLEREEYYNELDHFRVYYSERADLLDSIVADIDYIDAFEEELNSDIGIEEHIYLSDDY